MTIDDALAGTGGQQLVNRVASAFNIDPAAAQTAVKGLVDALKFRIERNMLSRGGVADVASLVTNPTAGDALSGSAELASASATANGNAILDLLIGDKHISRGIAARVASASGIDASTAEQMLPAVASLLIGEMQRQAQPALQKLASGVPGLVGAGGSPLPMPGDRLPDPSSSRDIDPTPTPVPRPTSDINGGSPLPIPGDNIPGLGRQRQAPQDQPDDNPLNRLPDIIRRGGGPSPSGGGSLEDVIRSIFGQLLGSNRGVIGTMIQLFVIRWIASLIRGVLGKAIGGR